MSTPAPARRSLAPGAVASLPRSPFGNLLRQWRARRGWSQAQLADAAGTTPRHLSFVESGRSRPGVDLVLRLARALDLPIRERNALCAAAGLPAAYRARALSDAALQPVLGIVNRLLAAHDPYPGWLIGRGFRFLIANRTGEALMPGLCESSPEEVIDLLFGPGPFRVRVENWNDVVQVGLDLLRREAVTYDAPALEALWRRAQAHLGEALPAQAGADCPDDAPVVCPRFRVGERVVRTIGAVMRFDTAVEQTPSELRLELMCPADAEADAFFRELAATATGQ